MGQLLDFNKFYRFGALSLVFASAILLSSCAKVPSLMPKETAEAKAAGEAVEKVQAEKKADKKAEMEEEKEVAQEKKAEKVEDKEFALMKKQLMENAARAAANTDNPDVVSRVFFDKEMLALNERIHTLSKRIEDLSERTHHMAQRLEHDPLKIAELELAIKSIEERIAGGGAEHKAPRHGMTKSASEGSGKAFWGIQIAAYKTKAGAEEAWAELLNNPMAIELQEAKVQYIQTKPLKNGKRLILIVINDYPNHKAANDACESMKERGIDCVAARIRP